MKKKREQGEAVISGADVDKLTDILAGKSVPEGATDPDAK